MVDTCEPRTFHESKSYVSTSYTPLDIFRQAIVLELEPILSPADIPTGIAVHGTTRKAWDIISKFEIRASLLQ